MITAVLSLYSYHILIILSVASFNGEIICSGWTWLINHIYSHISRDYYRGPTTVTVTVTVLVAVTDTVVRRSLSHSSSSIVSGIWDASPVGRSSAKSEISHVHRLAHNLCRYRISTSGRLRSHLTLDYE